MSTTPRLGLPLITTGDVLPESRFNNAQLAVDQFCFPSVIDREHVEPDGTENDGDAYLVAASGVNEFLGHDGEIAYKRNGSWEFVAPKAGFVVFVVLEEAFVHYRYSHLIADFEWTDDWTVAGDTKIVGATRRSAMVGITASTTQTQGQGLLTADVNKVITVANANDTVTLPVEEQGGRMVWITNRGANTLQVFPNTNGTIDGGAMDASVTIAAGKTKIFAAVDADDWHTVLGA